MTEVLEMFMVLSEPYMPPSAPTTNETPQASETVAPATDETPRVIETEAPATVEAPRAIEDEIPATDETPQATNTPQVAAHETPATAEGENFAADETPQATPDTDGEDFINEAAPLTAPKLIPQTGVTDSLALMILGLALAAAMFAAALRMYGKNLK